MPAKSLKTMAENMGVSQAQAEKAWGEAKSSAKEKGLTEGSDRFYEYTMGVTKKIMNNMKSSSALRQTASTFGRIAASLKATPERDPETGKFVKGGE